MTVYRIRFEGPATLAVGVATALADADGVDLTSSGAPTKLDDHTIQLDFSVEATHDDATAAVSDISDTLPDGASIEFT